MTLRFALASLLLASSAHAQLVPGRDGVPLDEQGAPL
jgi:hypothetical protein